MLNFPKLLPCNMYTKTQDKFPYPQSPFLHNCFVISRGKLEKTSKLNMLQCQIKYLTVHHNCEYENFKSEYE